MLKIPKRPLGRTGEQATIFGLGGEGVLRSTGRMNEAVDVIQRALDLGVNYYDSAPAYANCLDYLGEALGDRRSDVFVASKTHERSRDGAFRLLDQTLSRLRTDRLDLWQLHDLRTHDELDRIFAPDGALRALLQAREDGRVRFLGITGHHDPEVLLEAMRRFDFDTVLVALNAADRHRMSFIETVLPEAKRQSLGVIAMKVYAQGALLGPSALTADDALGYALSWDGVSTAILGCSTPAEVEANARIACEFAQLDDQAMAELEKRTSRYAARFTAYKKSPLVSLDG